MRYKCATKNTVLYAKMAASASRACYTSEQVVAFLDDDGEAELDDCFFPGSDDELGFEEIEVAQSEDEDEDTKYDTINMYDILNSL